MRYKSKGVFDRGASLIQMGLIITTTFSFVLIPLLTEQLQKKNHQLVNEYANTSLKITVLFSMAAAFGLMNLLPLLNTVFFKTNELIGTLSVFMLTVVFVTFIIMYTALLQVKLNRNILFIALIIGMVTKLIGNYWFVLQFGIFGASLSTVILSLAIYTLILHVRVMKLYQFQRMGLFMIKVSLYLQSCLYLYKLYCSFQRTQNDQFINYVNGRYCWRNGCHNRYNKNENINKR